MSDEERFDDLTKELANGGISRGQILRWLGATLLGVLTGGGALGALAKPALAAARWGEYKMDHCTSLGFRQYSAILWDIPWPQSWWTACANTPGNPAGIAPRPPDRCRRRLNMWGEWDVPTSPYTRAGCPYWWSNDREEVGFSTGCSPEKAGVRWIEGQLIDIPSGVDWRDTCAKTPGWQGRLPEDCIEGSSKLTFYGIYGTWYVPDSSCCREAGLGGCDKYGTLLCRWECLDPSGSGQLVSRYDYCPWNGPCSDFGFEPGDDPRDDPQEIRTSGGTYVVQSGDTLSEIAVQLGTTVEYLAELNSIIDPDVIYAGQTLYY